MSTKACVIVTTWVDCNRLSNLDNQSYFILSSSQLKLHHFVHMWELRGSHSNIDPVPKGRLAMKYRLGTSLHHILFPIWSDHLLFYHLLEILICIVNKGYLIHR